MVETMNPELVRIVDNIARDKNIDRESIFVDLEEAMISAARKHFGDLESEIVVHIDRMPGGKRKVTQISEFTGIDPDLNRVNITDIYNVRPAAGLRPTGYLPSFIDHLVQKELLNLDFLCDQPTTTSPQNGAPPTANNIHPT